MVMSLAWISFSSSSFRLSFFRERITVPVPTIITAPIAHNANQEIGRLLPVLPALAPSSFKSIIFDLDLEFDGELEENVLGELVLRLFSLEAVLDFLDFGSGKVFGTG